jgi:8-oxo-dGTP pyrophosphatase MutT (NUDIX family)
MKYAAGILIKCGDEYLLGQRAYWMRNYGGFWSTFGGAIESEEGAKEAALRELREETEYTGVVSNVQEIFRKDYLRGESSKQDDLRYFTFLGEVEEKFSPILNKENVKFGWFKLSDFPKKLHPGLQDLIEARILKENFKLIRYKPIFKEKLNIIYKESSDSDNYRREL